MTFSIIQIYLIVQYIVSCILFQDNIINHRCSPVFTVNTIYVSTTTVIYLYSTVVLLAHLIVVVVEKAIYEAKGVK